MPRPCLLAATAAALAASACGWPPPVAPEPSGQALVLASAPAASGAVSPRADSPTAPYVERAPAPVAGCRLAWSPRPMRLSVATVRAEHVGRFAGPLVEAACACVRPGEVVRLVAHVVPGRGEMSVTTGAGEGPDTRVEPGVEACLGALPARPPFAPFALASDSLPPPVWSVSRSASRPREGRGGTIVYPLVIDRRAEARSADAQGLERDP